MSNIDLTSFVHHGVEFTTRRSGNQWLTTCPFCDRRDKFYINSESFLWDCKVCGKTGDFKKFLFYIHERNQGNMNGELLSVLAENRKLPVEAFEGMGIGHNGTSYSLPAYNLEGELIDVKTWKPGEAVWSTRGCKKAMVLADRIAPYQGDDVYVCEGEWDTYALNWLLNVKLKKNVLVIGVPGATTWVQGTEEFLADKTVYLLFDNDEAGMKGEKRAYGRLTQISKRTLCVHWPENKTEGYDVRDHVVKNAVRFENPEKAARLLHAWCHETPRDLGNLAVRDENGKKTLDQSREARLDPITFSEVVDAYKQYLYMEDITPLKVVFGMAFANRMAELEGGQMLWMFIVAPPSTMKTELIQSLETSKYTESVSDATNAALVSGFSAQNGKDPSILRQWNGKLILFKDYTEIMAKDAVTAGQWSAILRGAYDGKVERMYGNTQHRKFKCSFGLLAGVTPAIEKLAMVGVSLGERFVRYRLPDIANQDEMLGRVHGNTGHVAERRTIMKEAANRFLNMSVAVPDFLETSTLAAKLKSLAIWTGKLRTVVERDFRDRILYEPKAEGPGRVYRSLHQMMMGTAAVDSSTEVREEDYRIAVDIARSTIPQRVDKVVEYFAKRGEAVQARDIATDTGLTMSTVRFVLEDMAQIKIVIQQGRGGAGYWVIAPDIAHRMRHAEIYPLPAPATPTLTIRLPKKR
jgi:hypothetical protein